MAGTEGVDVKTTNHAKDVTSPTEATDNTVRNSIISIAVVFGIIILVVVLSYLIWRRFFKSIRPKHGIENLESKEDLERQEKEKEKKARRKDFYDQFNVDDNQLTVNSVTAIKFDDEQFRINNGPAVVKSESETQEPSQPKPPKHIDSGKRIFSVDKVPEKPIAPDPMVIKLPKSVARSLQAGDSKQFTFAVIDQNSKTIHNIDMREYRMVRGDSPDKYGNVHRVHLATNHHHHHRHSRASPKRAVFSDSEYLHDSPDGERKKYPYSHSADETGISTDSSGSPPSSEHTRTPSLSSQDEPLLKSKPLTSPKQIKLSNIETDHSAESGQFSNGSDASDRLLV